MATFKPILKDSAPAGADLSSKQHHFVKLSSGKYVVATAGDAAWPLENAPKADEGATVTMAGFAKVVCGATVTEGAKVTADANAQCIPAVATNHVNGVALEAGVANQVIRISAAAVPTIF